MISSEEFCKCIGKIMDVRDSSTYLSKVLGTESATALDYLVPTVCELLATSMDMDGNVYGTIIKDYVYQNEYGVVIHKKRYTIMSHQHLYKLLIEMKKEDSEVL